MFAEAAMNAFLIASLLTGVDPTLLSAICYVESKHDAGAYVAMDGTSPSYGICQIKLNTARHMGFVGSASELMHPTTNAVYAAKYLQWQKRRYKDQMKAISAFNCGHACNNKSYIQKVMQQYRASTTALVAR